VEKKLKLKIDSSKIIIVGDRVFTDIYLSNLIGGKSILVPPIE